MSDHSWRQHVDASPTRTHVFTVLVPDAGIVQYFSRRVAIAFAYDTKFIQTDALGSPDNLVESSRRAHSDPAIGLPESLERLKFKTIADHPQSAVTHAPFKLDLV